jgi:CheY-like chemotaxis protein
MKLSLLIVDDDEVMRDTLSDVLKKKGYEVSVASSGNEALSAILICGCRISTGSRC